MFRFVPQLRTLGIGETPISVIPANAFEVSSSPFEEDVFQYIPHLIRLEMSEAAVDTIERGAFQRTPNIQAIVLNKNRLTQSVPLLPLGEGQSFVSLWGIDDRCRSGHMGPRSPQTNAPRALLRLQYPS